MDYDVFISCKSEDYYLAEQIYDFLQQNNVKTFLASKELRRLGQSEYRRAISSALKSSKHIIIFASKADYIDSEWVYYEWDMFLNAKLNGFKEGQILTILKDVNVKNINMDLWKYESLDFNNYKDTLLYYVQPKEDKTKSKFSSPVKNNHENQGNENDYLNPEPKISTDRFDLILESVGKSILPVIKLIKDYTGLGAKDSKQLVESVRDGKPQVIQYNKDKFDLQHLIIWLKQEGATVTLRPNYSKDNYHTNDLVDVILEQIGDDPLQTAKYIKELIGWDFVKTKNLIDIMKEKGIAEIIKSNINYSEAKKIKKDLEELDCVVRIRQ